VSVRWCRKC